MVCLPSYASGLKFSTAGGGTGDITGVFDCSTGACTTPTIATGEYLDGGTATVDEASEGILAPRGNDCSAAITDGQLCWDSDNDLLYVGTGVAASEIGSGGASEFTNVGKDIYPDNTDEGVLIGGTNWINSDILFSQDGGAVFNDQGAAVNFRVETDTEQNAILLDGTNQTLTINVPLQVSGDSSQISGDSGGFINFDTANSIAIGMSNGTYNESILLDFDSTSNAVLVTSTTGVHTISFDTVAISSDGVSTMTLGRFSEVKPEPTKCVTLIEPDQIFTVSQDVAFFHFNANKYPNGIEITKAYMTTSTSADSTQVWIAKDGPTSPSGTKLTTLNTSTSSATASEVPDTEGTVGSGKFLFVSIDNVNVNWSQACIDYYKL